MEIVALVLLITTTLFQGYTGQPAQCCTHKTVGGVEYNLVDEVDTSGYNCLSSCVYEKVDSPGSRFCFASGHYPVSCGDGGSLQSCSPVAPKMIHPLIRFFEEQAKKVPLTLKQFALETFVQAKVAFDVPGIPILTKMVQYQISEWYEMIKGRIQKAKENDEIKENLSVNEEQENGEIAAGIVEQLTIMCEAYEEWTANLREMKGNTTYMDTIFVGMISSQANDVLQLLGDQSTQDDWKKWDTCLLDASLESPKSAEIIHHFFTRDEAITGSDKWYKKWTTMFSSPYLADSIATVLQAGIRGLPGKSQILSGTSFCFLKNRIEEIPFEKMIFMDKEIMRKTMGMMMKGQAPELEKLMDVFVRLVDEDIFLNISGTDELYQQFLMTLNGMQFEDCHKDFYIFGDFIQCNVKIIVEWLEKTAKDTESGDLQAVEEAFVMVEEIMGKTDEILKQNKLWCKIEPMMIMVVEQIQKDFKNMVTNFDEEGSAEEKEDNIETTDNLAEGVKLEMSKLFQGECSDF